MTAVVYDAGALIAADCGRREFWADHRVRLEADIVPVVPAPVVVQVSRRSAQQVQLRRLLRGCDVVALDEADAHAAGRLLGLADGSDAAHAVVVQAAIARGADIVTGDHADVRRLLDVSGSPARIIDV